MHDGVGDDDYDGECGRDCDYYFGGCDYDYYYYDDDDCGVDHYDYYDGDDFYDYYDRAHDECF